MGPEESFSHESKHQPFDLEEYQSGARRVINRRHRIYLRSFETRRGNSDNPRPMTVRASWMRLTIGPGGVPTRTSGTNCDSSSAPKKLVSSRTNISGTALR